MSALMPVIQQANRSASHNWLNFIDLLQLIRKDKEGKQWLLSL